MSDWQTLGEVVTLQRGTTYLSRRLGEPGPVLLGLGAIQRHGGFKKGQLKTYGGESADKLLLRPGDLFLSLKDVTQDAALLGAVARVPTSVGVGRLTQDTVKLTIKATDVRADYLYWVLRTPQYREYCRQHAIGTTNLSLSREDFLSYSIPPATADRVKLIILLEAIESKIAVNDRIAATYDSLFQAKFVELGTAEEGDCPVTELVDFNPRTPRPSQEDAVYVDMAALPTRQSSIRTWTRRPPKGGSRFQNGDTLLARITPCLENRKTGYVDFLKENETGAGSTEFIVMRSREGVPPEFSYFLARDERFREHAIRKMVGSSGRQRVSAAEAAQFFVRRPNLGRLSAFGAEVGAAFRHLKSLMEESRVLERLRDTLLLELMSGRLRVKDAQKVAEEAV